MFLNELELVRAKREEGQRATLEGFFHQLKNLGESAERLWLMGDDPTFRHSVETAFPSSYEDLKQTNWRLAPFPETYEGLGATLSLWGRKDVLCVENDQISELLTKAVELATQCLIANAFKGQAVNSKDRRKQAGMKLATLKAAESRLKENLHNSIAALENLHLVEPTDQESEKYQRCRAFKHFIVRLCEETMIHGDLTRAIRIEMQHVPAVDRWNLIWTNYPRPRNPEDDLQKALVRMGMRSVSFPGVKRGGQVNLELVTTLLGKISIVNNFANQPGDLWKCEATSLSVPILHRTDKS
jgi:hypothetical protein